MSNKKNPMLDNGGPAYPRTPYQHISENKMEWVGMQDGMSLRDWFAGRALAGMLSNSNPGDRQLEDFVDESYMFANAMLKRRVQLDLIDINEDNIEIRCPDDGKCHHNCQPGGECFRVRCCGPLSVSGETWDDIPGPLVARFVPKKNGK